MRHEQGCNGSGLDASQSGLVVENDIPAAVHEIANAKPEGGHVFIDGALRKTGGVAGIIFELMFPGGTGLRNETPASHGNGKRRLIAGLGGERFIV